MRRGAHGRNNRGVLAPGRLPLGLVLLLLLGCRSSTETRPADEVPVPGAPEEPADPSTTPEPVLPGVANPDAALTKTLRAAAATHLAKNKPRTHHLNDDGSPRHVNRLARETSPYLLQHAFNPVNFRPWGDDAFEVAKRDDKPVLLSIGYSTCHWCHVMERESFDDEEIAAYLNAHYVSIKVDREERPDLDDIYMSAVNLLVGRGGWPMTVLLTPDREPFFGGTYFPARDGDRGARKGFLTILQEMKQRFATEREAVVTQAGQISRQIAAMSRPQRPGDVPGPEAMVRAAQGLARGFDSKLGGFGRAPKFPQPSRLAFLSRYHRRTGDDNARRMVVETLQKMAAGGIYDHVGGGFHRYSVDARWLVPHFEKMLYDNAQLAVAYMEGYQLTGDANFARVATEILDYVTREMTHGKGGFYSATDADSATPEGHEEEGYFFTWTPDEVLAVLGAEDAKLVFAHYGITPRGNFEGRTIFNTPRPLAEVAKEQGVVAAQLEARLAAARQKLYDVRAKRIPPLRDDKIITSWNGLMISAFARAGFALGRDDYVLTAAKAAAFLLHRLRGEDGRLRRTFMHDEGRHNAYLEDHAFLVAALLDLFQATADGQWLREAIAIQKTQDAHFADEDNGAYFATSDDHEKLIARDKPNYDGAVPSANSVATGNLLRLAELTTDMTYRQRAERALSTFAAELGRGGRGLPRMLGALDFYLDRPLEVFVVYPEGQKPGPLLDTVRRAYLPNAVIVAGPDPAIAALATQVPLLNGKVSLRGKPTAFVCEQGRCELPTSDPRVLARQLDKRARLLPEGDPPPLVIQE